MWQAGNSRAEAEVAVTGGISSFSVKSQGFWGDTFSTDWIRPTQIIKDNLLYLKATDCRVNHIYQKPSHQHQD